MSLAGHAFLALWNDIARSREPEYDQWHTLEHVPERVGVTGFYGSRRYVNRSRQYHRYFTLYDVASPATFDSSEYVDLLEHPTPWSASTAAVLMIAERASDLILGQESVPQAETAEALP